MFAKAQPVLDAAAETRRRELPVSVALLVLTGGLSAAILGEGGPIGWAALMVPLLIAEAELYRRLDIAGARASGRLLWLLCGWAFLLSCLYASLPMALWLSGGSSACAAAMVLWIAGVIRQLGVGAGAPAIAMAGAAPPALSLLLSPLAMVAMSARPDWDLAVIAAVGGGALLIYVAQARLAAEEAEHALRARIRADESEGALAWLAIEQAPFEACLIDRDLNIAAMTRAMRRTWQLDETAAGASFEDVFSWRLPHWRQALLKALDGETVLRAEDVIATPNGVRWLVWEARPWRGADGEVRGALLSWRDVTALAEARRAAEAGLVLSGAEALVVDGDDEARAQVCDALERAGFRTCAAANADQAMDAIEAARPSLIVLDVDLPDGAGWRLLRALTSSEATRSVAVIALSAAEQRSKALSFGACEHLVKPAEREMLAAAAMRFARTAAQGETTKPAAPATVSEAKTA
jgi:CheY-like chemotaxis protein/PAS domain-containing protein